MARISLSQTFKYSIHADGSTETLSGIVYLIGQIESLEKTDDRLKIYYLTRLVIISSSYLVEQVFAKSVRKFITDASSNSTNTIIKRLLGVLLDKRYSLKRVGISRAMEEWPKELTGKRWDLGREPFQSWKILIQKRNDIIHSLVDTTK
jgi:hypothetical protein